MRRRVRRAEASVFIVCAVAARAVSGSSLLPGSAEVLVVSCRAEPRFPGIWPVRKLPETETPTKDRNELLFCDLSRVGDFYTKG